MRGSGKIGLYRLDDKGLADVGLARPDVGRARRSLFTIRLGERQRVLPAGNLRGLVSSVAVALLLVLALFTAESRPTDHLALVSCPLFHPGIMGSASRNDSISTNSWVRCQIRTR